MARIEREVGKEMFKKGMYKEACKIFTRQCAPPTLDAFLTLNAYNNIGGAQTMKKGKPRPLRGKAPTKIWGRTQKEASPTSQPHQGELTERPDRPNYQDTLTPCAIGLCNRRTCTGKMKWGTRRWEEPEYLA
ncbi:hypothetical protein RJ641_009030 [Dillenia turbinata]|uniref:Malate synthase C-terminal domain-containing protein n=1 Tax=Dillenia turbinata TaxID=194707 RepID=A0AAN8Z348_9MAGN